MKEIQKYYCDKCEKDFLSKKECEQHEKDCQVVHTFTCDKCGKEIKYTNDRESELYFNSEECHHINLGRPGYGSGLDGCEVNFNICGDCLIEFINTFTWEGKEKVLNSGSNTYLSSEDWIRVHKDEMPDEEMEEKGMYSPRQWKAYEEQFPKCDKVKIYIYPGESKGSYCYKHAFGDGDGKVGLNCGRECFNCDSYKERAEGQEIPIEYVEDKDN